MDGNSSVYDYHYQVQCTCNDDDTCSVFLVITDMTDIAVYTDPVQAHVVRMSVVVVYRQLGLYKDTCSMFLVITGLADVPVYTDPVETRVVRMPVVVVYRQLGLYKDTCSLVQRHVFNVSCHHWPG